MQIYVMQKENPDQIGTCILLKVYNYLEQTQYKTAHLCRVAIVSTFSTNVTVQ